MEIEDKNVRFSLPVSYHVLKYITNNGDKKRLRLICRNWRTAIDQLIGLDLKLNPKNKAKLFDSHIINQCISIKIQGDAGTLPWYTCPFHTNKLRKVILHGEITVDNWRLLTEKCQSIETMFIELQKEPKEGVNTILKWNFWSKPLQFRINLNCLTRFFVKGAFDSLDFQSRAIVNMLRTTTIPNLHQLVLIKGIGRIHPTYLNLKTVIRDMKQNCRHFKTFGFVDWKSRYSQMDYWDNLLLNRKNALVIQQSFSEWQLVLDVFHQDSNLDEVHYDLALKNDNADDFNHIGNCIQDLSSYSKNIRTLSLHLTVEYFCGLNCTSLRLLHNLRTLEVKQRIHERGSYMQFLAVTIVEFPPLLEKVSFWSVTLSEENLRTVLQQCLQIQEICMRNQYNHQVGPFSPNVLTRANIERALNHATLKILVLDSFCEQKVRQHLSALHENHRADEWSILCQTRDPPQEITKCKFQPMTGYSELIQLNPDKKLPLRLRGDITMSEHIKKGMALLILNNVNEAQLLEFEKDYN